MRYDQIRLDYHVAGFEDKPFCEALPVWLVSFAYPALGDVFRKYLLETGPAVHADDAYESDDTEDTDVSASYGNSDFSAYDTDKDEDEWGQ
jgi:hypothetical protein